MPDRKRILIVGAARGLGLCLTRKFDGCGHEVYAGIRMDHENPEFEALMAKRPGIRPLPMDVTEEAQLESSAKKIEEHCGQLDIIICNAGIIRHSDRSQPIDEMVLSDLRAMLEVNVIGAAAVVRYVSRLLTPKGVLLFITSEAGSMGCAGNHYCGYSISKTAENKLAAIVASAMPERKVYAVHPGRMHTHMGRFDYQIEPEESADGIYALAMGRLTPERSLWFIDYKGAAMEP